MVIKRRKDILVDIKDKGLFEKFIKVLYQLVKNKILLNCVRNWQECY